MGYDMRWQDDPSPEQCATKDAARVEFDRCVKLRNAIPRDLPAHELAQESVDLAYAALMKADVGYFRLNSWGMSETRPWLLKVDAAHDRGEHPAWPNEDDYEGGYEDPAYEAASDRVRAAGVEFPGIPIWKLGSNDWWHVTPIECRSAVLEAAKHEDELSDAPDYVREFLLYIGEAALHGGFRVG